MATKEDIANIRKRFYGMKSRCYNIKCPEYIHYGNRDIKICDEWLNDINSFIDWAINNGYRKELSIDRINVDGNYEPSNCRWVDRKTQSLNRRKLNSDRVNRKPYSIVEKIALETNRSIQTIYKLANRFGRLPTNEEVLNTKSGRPRKYQY